MSAKANGARAKDSTQLVKKGDQVLVPARKVNSSGFDPHLENLAKEVLHEHKSAQSALAAAVLHAYQAGRALNAMKGYLGHGEWIGFLEGYFCRPHGLSVRTAQRYMKIADGYPALLEALKAERESEGDAGAKEESEEALLTGVRITRALQLIRTAVNAQEEDTGPEKNASGAVGPNDWWTPKSVVNAVERLFGRIDLDPCACSASDPMLATTRIIPPQDGLSHAHVWSGAALINPGFKTNPVGWVQKTSTSFAAGTLTQAVLLLPAITNSDWAQSISSFPRAFFRSPFAVNGPGRSKQLRIATPAMLVYVGPSENFATFANVFRDTHDVFIPV